MIDFNFHNDDSQCHIQTFFGGTGQKPENPHSGFSKQLGVWGALYVSPPSGTPFGGLATK